MRDDLATKTAELIEYDVKVNKQLEDCGVECEQFKEHILDNVKARFTSSEYSTSSSSESTSSSLSSGISAAVSSSSMSNDLSNTTARLDTQLNKNKETASTERPAASKVGRHAPEKRVLETLLNKTAEEHVAQLDFDEAYESLLTEVNKLEKKFVAQKTNKGEISLRKRMNELLLRQIELAEEKRTLYEDTLAKVLSFSRDLQEEVSKERLDRAVDAIRSADVKFHKDMKAAQDLFDYNLIQTEEYFNSQLLDINAKRIFDMQKTAAVKSKKLERETRQLVSDMTEFEGKRLKYAEVSDELFDQLKEESKAMMDKFTKVYKAAEEIIEENRNVDVNDKRQMRNKKTPLQTEVIELYTGIHSLQHDFAENPILDFEMELSSICDDYEANATKFLGKSDEMYKGCQETYMNLVLGRYN